MIISFKRLNAKATEPCRMTETASGYDLFACIDEDISLGKGARYAVPTGLAVAIPVGFEAQIRPRSGLALKHGITVLNSPGTIDADYRGEIKVILINLGQEAFTIQPNMRIAQMVFARVESVDFIHTNELSESSRDSGGFGHTGV